MDTLRLCPQCRQPLTTLSTDRLCLKCQSDPGRTTPPTCAGICPPPPTPAEIAQFFPQLEILELLGHGGMGMVYKARQPQLNRFVALKILAPELSGDPAFAERFSREAQSLARLNHSNIVGIFDFGQAAHFYYFLMEYVEGANLHALFHGVQMPPDEARRIIVDVCHALQFAHEEGVIHRDIKPSNILIDKKGRVKIADFGLAKLTGQAGEETVRAAVTTTVMGTPHYIAPEQIEKPSSVDHRVDLYSVGVVYYEMRTGELPLGRFQLPSQTSPAVDQRLDEVVLRALEKDPNRRYQKASEIRTAVESVTGLVQTVDYHPPAPQKEPPRTHGLFREFGLMAGTALLAVFFYVLLKDHWPGKQPRPNGRAEQVGFANAPEGSILGKRIVAALQLSKTQIPEVNRTIRRYQREFLVLERRHTEHSQDKAGHVHITVKAFPGDMDKLLTKMWQDLGAILTPEQLATARTLDFEKFFPNTGNGVHVEIWRDPNGEEHYVESEDPGPNAAPLSPNRLPAPMPPRYRSYLPDN